MVLPFFLTLVSFLHKSCFVFSCSIFHIIFELLLRHVWGRLPFLWKVMQDLTEFQWHLREQDLQEVSLEHSDTVVLMMAHDRVQSPAEANLLRSQGFLSTPAKNWVLGRKIWGDFPTLIPESEQFMPHLSRIKNVSPLMQTSSAREEA